MYHHVGTTWLGQKSSGMPRIYPSLKVSVLKTARMSPGHVCCQGKSFYLYKKKKWISDNDKTIN